MTKKAGFIYRNLSASVTVRDRNMTDLVFLPAWISIFRGSANIYRLNLPVWHTNMFPPLRPSGCLFCSSSTFPSLSVSLTAAAAAPPSLSSSTQCSLAHILAVCLFLILPLISILRCLTRRRIGCSSASQAAVCCWSCATTEALLPDPPCACLEELKDALSPGTSGLPTGQKGSVSEIVLGKRTHTGSGFKEGDWKLMCDAWDVQRDVAAVAWGGRAVVVPASSQGSRYSRGSSTFLSPFFFRQRPCPRGRSQERFNIQAATQTSHPTPRTLMQSIFYFLTRF